MPNKELGQEVVAMYDRQVIHRQQSHDRDWQLISRYLDPQAHQFFSNNANTSIDRNAILDGTAERSCEDLSSALLSMLVNPSKEWFNLGTVEGNESYEEQKYFDHARKVIRDYFGISKSNFYHTAVSVFENTVIYGQHYVLQKWCEENKIIRYSAVPTQEVYVQRDEYWEVDYYFRKLTMTPRQIRKEFADSYGSQMTSGDWEALAQKEKLNPNEQIEIVQAIFPRTDKGITGLLPQDKKFANIFVWHDKKIVLKEHGFDRFPVIAPVWKLKAGQNYGHGPGHRAISDILTLNLMVRDNLAASQLILTPPIIAPFGLVLDDEIDMSAKAIIWLQMNAASFSTQFVKPEALHIVQDLPVALDREDQRREAVRLAFYLDLLQDLTTAEQSATEFQGKYGERVAKLSSPFLRYESEYMEVAVEYAHETLIEKGILNPPASLKNKKRKVFFTTALDNAYKQMKLAAFERASTAIANLKGAPPQIFDGFDIPNLNEYVFDKAGADLSILKDKDQVRAEAAASKQANANQQDLASIKDAGAGLKNLASAAQIAGQL